MKKLMLLVFALIIALPSFAALKEKDVIGTWKYKVETDQGDITGTIVFEKKEGKLVGEVHTDDGQILPFGKVEIQENDMVYMELDTGYEMMKVSVTVKSKVFEGRVVTDQVDFPITGEKVE